MTRIITILALLLAPLLARGQDLGAPQLTTICTAVKADSGANASRIAGSINDLLGWLNGPRSPTALAWSVAVSPEVSDEAPKYETYDSLVAGKRDSWVRFLRASSRDFSKAKIRKWVTDIWGNATAGSNSEAILLAATQSATNAQYALGGTTRTTGTVSALDLTYPRPVPSSAAEWLVVAANCS